MLETLVPLSNRRFSRPIFLNDRKGNTIYRVPRRYPSIARVVDCEKFDAMPMVMDNPSPAQIDSLLDLLEHGPESPTQTWWESTEVFHVKAHLEKNLAAYARPIFLRLQHEIEVTGTFKHRKVELVRDGFDPRTVKDPLYFLDPVGGHYVALTQALHDRIVSGEIRL